MRCKERNVVRALTQGEELYCELVDTVVEVLAKAPFGNGLAQIFVRGCEDPHIHLDVHLAADAFDGVLLQHAQQADLVLIGEVPDLIQE